jgi:hypothetical protein
VQAILENGVSRDIVKAGMADLVSAPDPELEFFHLNGRQVALVANTFGREGLTRRGLL